MPGAEPASRYDTIVKLAAGGMATVWIGTVRGALGFRQLVAIKKPHPHLMGDPTFRSELIAEARLASMIHHANVVDVRDVEIEGDAISLVMDYIEGASLGDLLVAAAGAGQHLPPRVAVRIIVDALAGLHAAHELVDERGRSVGLVHRDVSPQNILVGLDGISRVADFGVAKFSRKNTQSTSGDSLKGKLAYMAPEYLRGESIDRRFDIFAVGVVLWESLVGERCFRRTNEAETLHALLTHHPLPASALVRGLSQVLDPVLAKALGKSPKERYQTAAEMAAVLEKTASAAQLIAGPVEVSESVRALTGELIDARRALVRAKLSSEPSIASLLGVPADLVPSPASYPTTKPKIPVAADATRVLPQTPPRGPVRTLPLGSSLTSLPTQVPTPISVPVPHPAAASSSSPISEYVSDLSAIGISRRRRSKWPFGIAILVMIAALVGIALKIQKAEKPRSTPVAATTGAVATEYASASMVATATTVAPRDSIAPAATSAPPLAAAPRPAAARPVAKPANTSRKPPPNPYDVGY